MSEHFHVLIPARLGSTRLPDKPLADLGGRPMVVRVLERALSAGAASVHVATDSQRVAQAVLAASGQVIMTRSDHASGTDRLVEAVESLGFDSDDVIVNLQGDEPLMPASAIRRVVEVLTSDPAANMATLYEPVISKAQWQDPNVVKLVLDAKSRALYFSRAPIPWPRGSAYQSGDALRHVGLYAYRVSALRNWPELPPSQLERLESLEQLRALSAGWTVACGAAPDPIPAGIDTADDLERIKKIYLQAMGER
ncbi:MAG: 3-deoxy-manno-octulosonate cytidylyltransferase [Wenzhouxiangella sp.]|nr:3-deoxy-manno-octulosonate cytidylyltransferase [Wenzhouxiangella sp.]